MKKLTTFLCAVTTAILVFAAPADKNAQPLRVLAIGNSFSICVGEHMPQVAEAMGCKLALSTLFYGGCTLHQHWDFYQGSLTNADYRPYRLDSFLNGKRTVNGTMVNVLQMITNQVWDVITIQQGSHESWRPECYHPYGDQFLTLLRQYQPQAKIVMQETWSYTPFDGRLKQWKIDQNQMYAKIHEAYYDFATKNGLGVIPMGTAVQLWRQAVPVKYTDHSAGGDVVSSLKFTQNADGTWKHEGDPFHLNGFGHYMQGLIWTAYLFNVDITSCSYKPDFVPADKAVQIKKIAMDALSKRYFDTMWLKGTTDKNPLTYKPGEEMVFTVEPTAFGGPIPKGYKLDWWRSADDGTNKWENGLVPFDGKPLVVKTKLAIPGFVRLYVKLLDPQGQQVKRNYYGDTTSPEGKQAMNVFELYNAAVMFDGGAGVKVDTLKNRDEPKDFDAYMAKQKARLAAVPVKELRRKEVCKLGWATVYAVEIACAGARPVTGYLTIPTKPGKYPCQLSTHGYNGGDIRHDTQKWGYPDKVCLNMNAHGLTLPAFGGSEEYYKSLPAKLGSNGYQYAFDPAQNANPDTAYFNGMYLRVVRGLQYLKTLPEWNGKDLWAEGGSQGGLQTAWAAGCGEGVTIAWSTVPWCCDLGGEEALGHNRGGWYPHWAKGLGYYDAVNHGKRVPKSCTFEIPRAGLGDYVCPPSGIAALYNALKCPKKISWMQGSEHGFTPPWYPGRDFVLESK